MSKKRNKVIAQFFFHSGREYLNQAINITYEKIISTSIPISLSDKELRLVLDESITNAMEHGNKWDVGKRVEVCIERCYDGMSIVVKDEGEGFNAEQMNLSEKKLSQRGKGIVILKHYCKCKWNPKGNALSIVLPVSNACDHTLESLLMSSEKKITLKGEVNVLGIIAQHIEALYF